jgi:hypothetical protein
MDTLHPHLKKRLEYLEANPWLKEVFAGIPLYVVGERCDGRVIGNERAGLPNSRAMTDLDMDWPSELDEEFKSGRSDMLDPYELINSVNYHWGTTDKYLRSKHTALSKSVKKNLLETFLISRASQTKLIVDLKCKIGDLYWTNLHENKFYRLLLDDSLMGILEGEYLNLGFGVLQLIHHCSKTGVFLKSTTIPNSWISSVADELYRYGCVTKDRDGKFIFSHYSRQNWSSDIDRWMERLTEEIKKTFENANEPGFRTELDRLIEELESNVASVSKSRMTHHDLHCHVFGWKTTKNHSDEIFQRAKKMSCPYLHWRHFVAKMERIDSPAYNKIVLDENEATIRTWKSFQQLLNEKNFRPRKFKQAIVELVKDRFERLFDATEQRKQSIFNTRRSNSQGS